MSFDDYQTYKYNDFFTDILFVTPGRRNSWPNGSLRCTNFDISKNVHIFVSKFEHYLLIARSTARSSMRTSPRVRIRTKCTMPFSAFLSFRIAPDRDSSGNGHSVGRPQRLKSRVNIALRDPSATPCPSMLSLQ